MKQSIKNFGILFQIALLLGAIGLKKKKKKKKFKDYFTFLL